MGVVDIKGDGDVKNDELNKGVADESNVKDGSLEGDTVLDIERQLEEVADDAKLLERIGVDEGRGEQLASKVEPGRQAAGQLHGEQEIVPGDEENVPAGQSVALRELNGQ